MAKITTTIRVDGAVTVEVYGVKGQSCAALTEEFENALGGATSREKRREWYEHEPRERVRQ